MLPRTEVQPADAAPDPERREAAQMAEPCIRYCPRGETDVTIGTDEAAALEALRRACERSLEQWPAARAALLYGSRARGDCRTGSDWDVMLLTDGAGYRDMPDRLPLLEFVPERGAEVNVCVYDAARMRRRAALTGSFDRSVARDGVLLAGRWARPDLDRESGMDIEDWHRYMDGALTKAARGWDCCVRAWKRPDPLGAFNEYVQFMADSADAAELLAKAALMRRGVTPEKVHDVSALAGQLQAERPGDAEAAVFAERLGQLNGDTKTLHVAVYHGDVGADDGIRAVRRVGGVLDLWVEELALADGDGRFSELAGNLAAAALDKPRPQTSPSPPVPERAYPAVAGSSGWPAAVREMDTKADELQRFWDVFAERVRALRPAPAPDPPRRKPEDGCPSPF